MLKITTYNWLLRQAMLAVAMVAMLTVVHRTAYAQVDSLALDKQYFKNYWTDTRDWVTAPVRWEGRDWLKLAGLAGLTATATLLDEPVNDWMLSSRSEGFDKVTKYGLEPLGNYYAVAAMGAFYTYGLISDNPRSRSTGLLMAESFIVSALLVRVPKYLAGRSRPDAWGSPGPNEWQGPFNGTSFPSGHTTSAFAVASVVAWQYKDTPWVPVTAYSLATLAGLSRIYDNRHWVSDVVAGAIFGTVTGLYISRQNQDRQLSLQPTVMGGVSGISMVYRW